VQRKAFPIFFVNLIIYCDILNWCLKVFVFSTSHKNWKLYNWSKVTTLVEVGYHDDEMVKYAHSKNVTVSYIGTCCILFVSVSVDTGCTKKCAQDF